MDNDRKQQIERRAYSLWQDAGQPEGGSEGFWYQAERELDGSGIGDEASAAGFARDADTGAKEPPVKQRKPRQRKAEAPEATAVPKAPRKVAARKPEPPKT